MNQRNLDVTLGAQYRFQALAIPYYFSVLEFNGAKLDPPGHSSLPLEHVHESGRLLDDCCYLDVDVTKINDDVLNLRVFYDRGLPTEETTLIEVLNDNTVIRLYDERLT